MTETLAFTQAVKSQSELLDPNPSPSTAKQPHSGEMPAVVKHEANDTSITPSNTEGLPESTPALAYSEDDGDDPQYRSTLLSRSGNGEMVVFDRASGNNMHFDPRSAEWSVVSQEVTIQPRETGLSQELMDAIHTAGSFDEAMKSAVYSFNHTNPRILVATITEITHSYPSEINHEILDKVATEAIDTGARLALGDTDPEGTRQDGIESMIDALPLLSSAKINDIIPRVQDTVEKIREEVYDTDRNEVISMKHIDPIRVEAASETLERLAEFGVDVQHVDVSTVLEQETTKVELLSRRDQLLQEIANIDQQVVTIDQSVNAEIGSAPRRGIFGAVRNLLKHTR